MNAREMTCKIAAGIVLFNPDDINRVLESIKSVFDQFDRVYVFDNSTKIVSIEYPVGVEYYSENSNKGVAYALNRIMEYAKRDGYDWVVSMDQDSILPKDLVNAYTENIVLYNNLGIVCPQVIDFRRTYETVKTVPKKEFVYKCITSASCTSIEAWEKVGKFDEWMFIDLVDNEFCKRLGAAGYKILKLNQFVLNQEFGKIIPKSKCIQKFWIGLSKLLRNRNIAKFSYKKFVSPMRVYYTNRNIIYVNKKMRNYGPTGYESFNCDSYIGFLISYSVPSVLRSGNKIATIKGTIDGIRDGVNKKVEAWEIE